MKLLSRLKSAIAIGSLALTIFVGVQIFSSVSAIAAPSSPTHLAATAQQLDRRAKSDVNQTVGAGTSDQLEGYVDQAKGTLEKNVGKVASSLEGTADQVQGRAKADIGQVKGALDDAADTVEESSEGLIDNVKDFFD